MAHIPKFFDEELNRDITRLNALRKVPGREAKKKYWALFEDIKARHKIGSSTVYGEMRKDRPGTYKGHVYHSLKMPVNAKEQRMVEELLSRKMINADIQKFMSRTLGIPYGHRRLLKIKKMIAVNPSPPEEASAFDDNIRALFYSFSMLDLSDPEASHIIRLKADSQGDSISISNPGQGSGAVKEYKVSTDALKDALDIIIYSVESGGMRTSAIHRIKMEQMLSRRMHFVEKGLSIPTPEMRQLEAIRKSLEQAPQHSSLTPDMKVLVACVREFNPEAPIPEIISAADKHAELTKNNKLNAGEYIRELMNITYEVLKENM